MHEYDNIIDVSESTFDEDVIESSWDIPVVVDFWAPWCGPCRTLGPALEALANEPGANFILARVNVDENPNLSIRYGIRSIPAVKGFSQGQIVAEFVGNQPLPVLRQFLKRVAPDENDALLNEANSLLGTHQWDDAEEAYRDVLDVVPNDRKAALGLARALLAQGRGEEAVPYLKMCRDGAELSDAEKLLPLAGFLRDFGERDGDGSDDDAQALQFRRAAQFMAEGNWESGLDGLLDVMRHNRRYRNDLARKATLGVFALFGDDADLTLQYRPELASVLF